MSLHSFSPDIAGRVGINAAVIYQNVLFWTQKNVANGKQVKDGKVWTYNSVKAWAELFPYLTENQIRTALAKLVEAGLIFEGNHNPVAYDRTKWYGVPVEIHLGKNTNGFGEKPEPIPDSKPVIKPDSKQDTAQAPCVDTPEPKSKGDPVKDALTAWASESAALSFIAYRKKSKGKALTETAAKRLAETLKAIFQAGADPDDALGMAEERGWLTVKADWYFREKERGNGNGYSKANGAANPDATARQIAFAAGFARSPGIDSF
jgi:hypothetical protein